LARGCGVAHAHDADFAAGLALDTLADTVARGVVWAEVEGAAINWHRTMIASGGVDFQTAHGPVAARKSFSCGNRYRITIAVAAANDKAQQPAHAGLS
jgi:hypothetical protein